jgi:hypothetical protein
MPERNPQPDTFKYSHKQVDNCRASSEMRVADPITDCQSWRKEVQYTRKGLLRPDTFEEEYIQDAENETGKVATAAVRAKAEEWAIKQREKAFLRECPSLGGSCCTPDCQRLVQCGLYTRLEVFRTPDGRGWGLRSVDNLAANTFICEYAGEVVSDRVAEGFASSDCAGRDAYLFDLPESCADGSQNFVLDAFDMGNLGRFINHDCQNFINIETKRVHVDCAAKGLPRIAFFTTRPVLKGSELLYDYAYGRCECGLDEDAQFLCSSCQKIVNCACKSCRAA